jgi:hypothetical protein
MKSQLYTTVLFLHSWLRWGVVLLGLLTLGRALHGWVKHRDWEPADGRMQRLFVRALDIQVLLGLTLYFLLSPLTPRSLDGLRMSMSVTLLRFFSIEHVTAMLLALVAANGFSSASRRAATPTARHRRWAIGLLVVVMLIVTGIPWPFLPYGRPLIRGF